MMEVMINKNMRLKNKIKQEIYKNLVKKLKIDWKVGLLPNKFHVYCRILVLMTVFHNVLILLILNVLFNKIMKKIFF